MDKIRIKGGTPLKGSITISGSKNSALPLMAASILTEKKLSLYNLPHLVDISTMSNLLIHLGVEFTLDRELDNDTSSSSEIIHLQATNITELEAPYDIVRKMRASVLVLGPLLARFGKAKVSLPGGCAIGLRPIDIHLKAFEQMGATIKLKDGYIIASVKDRLQGADISFDKVSVGATENVLMAATLAKGTTIIRNAAKEPEISDLAEMLKKMGADIEGDGTDTITIKGKKELHGTSHTVIPDRIEAATYIIAAAITKGDVTIGNLNKEHILSVINKLAEIGIEVTETKKGLRVKHYDKPIQAANIETQVYPGFPTDVQAQMMALLTIANGTSIVKEHIFENRFMHVQELLRMGADIKVDGHTAIINGVKKLTGAQVMATDLRASVSLVLAALAAHGETIINRVYHIDRGYERIEEKLSQCGAHIERIN